MRRLLLGAAAAVALSATPAMADVFVFADIEKDKYVDVDVDIDIFKFLIVDAEVFLNGEKAAEAETLVNQTNTYNHACENCAEKDDVIGNSVNRNNGVVSVNQASGNMNNQGNAVSVAVSGTAGDGAEGTLGALAHAQSVVDQRQGFFVDVFPDDDNGVVTEVPDVEGVPDVGDEEQSQTTGQSLAEVAEEAGVSLPDDHGSFGLPNVVNSINVVFRNAIITGSINDNVGGVHVNQSAGNINNQTNVFTAAIGQDAGVALSDVDLAQSNWLNQVNERKVVKTAQITGSITGNSGVVGVNQSSGNMANQANVFTLGAATAGLLGN